MSLNPSSWRRVASTHSLSDLLLDDTHSIDSYDAYDAYDSDESNGTQRGKPPAKQTAGTSKDTLKVRLLGVFLIILGTLSLFLCIFVAYSCFPSRMRRINDPIQCSDALLSLFHKVAIELGLHGVVVPALAGVARFWEISSGTPFPLIDLAIRTMKQEFPLGKDAFYSAIERRGDLPSEVVLYCLGIVPVLCVPVTLAMISMNWFSLKIFKHN